MHNVWGEATPRRPLQNFAFLCRTTQLFLPAPLLRQNSEFRPQLSGYFWRFVRLSVWRLIRNTVTVAQSPVAALDSTQTNKQTQHGIHCSRLWIFPTADNNDDEVVHFHRADTIPISRQQRISVFPKFFHRVDFFPAGCAILGGRYNESINGCHRPAPTSAILICTFCTPVHMYLCVYNGYVHMCILGWGPSPPLPRSGIAICRWDRMLPSAIDGTPVFATESGMLINYDGSWQVTRFFGCFEGGGDSSH